MKYESSNLRVYENESVWAKNRKGAWKLVWSPDFLTPYTLREALSLQPVISVLKEGSLIGLLHHIYLRIKYFPSSFWYVIKCGVVLRRTDE